jgi:hypothetical protein
VRNTCSQTEAEVLAWHREPQLQAVYVSRSRRSRRLGSYFACSVEAVEEERIQLEPANARTPNRRGRPPSIAS